MSNLSRQETIILKFVNATLKPGFIYKCLKDKNICVYKTVQDLHERNRNYATIPSRKPWMVVCHEVKETKNETKIEYLRDFEYKVAVFTKVLYKDDTVGWVDGLTFYLNTESDNINFALNNALCTVGSEDTVNFTENYTKLREVTEKNYIDE